MHITRYTDYAMRVLMYLGVRPNQRVTVREISDYYGISRHHLVKVVYHLSQAGYIDTIRGKGGGIVLRRPAAELRLGQLVRETEQDLELVECFGQGSQCRISAACRLKGLISEALEAFFATLDGYTLADLLTPGDELSGLLRAAPARAGALEP